MIQVFISSCIRSTAILRPKQSAFSNLFFSWYAFDNKLLLIAMMGVTDTELKKRTKFPWRDENSLLSYKAQKSARCRVRKRCKNARRASTIIAVIIYANDLHCQMWVHPQWKEHRGEAQHRLCFSNITRKITLYAMVLMQIIHQWKEIQRW